MTPSSRSDLLHRASWPALLGAAVCCGVATYLSTADAVVPLLAWIAPVPILAFAFAGARGPRIAAAAFLAGVGGNLAWVALYRGILPILPLFAFAVLFGAAFALAVWLTAWVVERRGAWAGALVFPSLWVSFEFAVARWSPHGTAGSLAYSQVDLVPLIQLAAWTGLSGITFIVLFVAAGVAAALGARAGQGIRWPLVAAPGATLLVALILGEWRVATMTREGGVLVGLVSIDGAMARFDTTRRDDAIAVAASYVDSGAVLAARQVDAIVMPEKMVGVAPPYEQEVSSLFSSLADRKDVLVIAGLNLVGRQQSRNVAAVFSRGSRVLEYDKQRLVPGLESEYMPGDGPGLYRAPGGMTGVAVCKDMDFPDLAREYSRAGVGILFVPAWDFTRDARLHSRMAVMRGVEGGFSVARAAANGLLSGSDDFGRIVAERASAEARQSMLLAQLPLGRGRTFYGEHGDWVGWGNVIAAAVILGLAAAGAKEH